MSIVVRGIRHQAEKQFLAGTHRTVSLAGTLEAVKPFTAHCGITRVANITGLDRVGIPVTVAIRPNSETVTCSAGKGLTLEAALASATMEAIELSYAERPRAQLEHRSYTDAARDFNMIPVGYLPLAAYSIFTTSLPIDWMLGWDLINEHDVAIPFSFVSLGLRRNSYDLPVFVRDTNGVASGNNFLEAVFAGLLEVIERDAIACNHEASIFARSIRVDSVPWHEAHALLKSIADAGLSVTMFDCTTDVGIPVFGTYIWDDAHPELGSYYGYGAHLDPHIALSRAITEAIQGRVVYIAGARDDYFKNPHRVSRGFAQSIYRNARAPSSKTTVPTYESMATSTFEDDIKVILSCLSRVQIKQALVVELTPTGLPFSAVKVFVPGLEGHPGGAYVAGARANKMRRLL